jgi:SAM-dependent methyltransferase
MLDPSLLGFVLHSLPRAPVRVLEVGAGDGALAQALVAAGYQVVAIDPASDACNVRAVPLHELSEPLGSFDAAVAVLSMHHVEPLPESCRRLAEVVRPGGTLVLDEFDVERFDAQAARWWLDQHEPSSEGAPRPEALVEDLRHHCHSFGDLLAGLEESFELNQPIRGPYLYRWELPPAMRDVEERLIAAGQLPETGVRIVGTRKEEPMKSGGA